jgi:hypothetical protein
MSMTGRVVAAPASTVSQDDAAYENPVPIQGASVTLTCPWHLQASTKPLARSDAGGRLHSAAIGDWVTECSFVVSADGYYPETFPLVELCPAGGQCGFVAIQAELSPKDGKGPPRPPQGAAAPAPSIPVHVVVNYPDVKVVKLVAEREPLKAWEPVCRPPCDASLTPSDRLAVFRGDGTPIEPEFGPRLSPGARLDVHYDDRSGQRRLAWILGLAGNIAGFALALAGGNAPANGRPWQAANIALVSGGLAVVLGSEAVVLLVGFQPDTVRMSP